MHIRVVYDKELAKSVGVTSNKDADKALL